MSNDKNTSNDRGSNQPDKREVAKLIVLGPLYPLVKIVEKVVKDATSSTGSSGKSNP